MNEDLQLIKRLEAMRERHRNLDKKIKELSLMFAQNQLLIVRLKKEKLSLRDEISQVEKILYPDIIA